MRGTVFIVHCVDTEGPLYESLDATFERIREAFGVELEPTVDIIRKLRNKEIQLDGNEEAVLELVKEGHIKYHDTWDKLYKMHKVLFSNDFRHQLIDSYGGMYCFNWFCIDHVDFRNNPRRRTGGYHAIFIEYQELIKLHKNKTDRIYWHFHPKSFTQDANRTGDNYSFSNLHNEILARRVIDHSWFPVASRPTHAEYMDFNLWLEQWIPFDFANQNMEFNAGLKKQELAGRVPGRNGDWRGAPTDWVIYHPSVWDSRKPGDLRRYIARCLNINCRHSMITVPELEKAFINAQNGRNVLVALTNHDFRNMISETTSLINMINLVAEKYPDVKFKWSNAVEAIRAVLKMRKQAPCKLNYRIEDNLLRVTSDKPLWGPQPFLALCTKEGNYYHDNFIMNSEVDWTYAFDGDSLLIDMISKIGIATNDSVGNTIVAVCDLKKPDEWNVRYLNTEDWFEE